MNATTAELSGQLAAVAVIVVGLAGTVAFFVVALTLSRSRGRGWGHVLSRWAKLTGLVSVAGGLVTVMVLLFRQV